MEYSIFINLWQVDSGVLINFLQVGSGMFIKPFNWTDTVINLLQVDNGILTSCKWAIIINLLQVAKIINLLQVGYNNQSPASGL